MELTHFNKAKNELMLATKIDEVKTIRDKAEALRAYTKQAGESLEMQNYCAEIKIRAERRAGELIPEQVRRPESGRPKEGFHDEGLFLKDIDISESQSHRWQAIASVPEEEFEEHIAKTKADKKELTSISVYRLAKKEEQKAYFKELESYDRPFDGRYDVVVIDPPWDMQKIDRDITPEQTGFDYPTMTEEEISAMDLPMADDCHFFMWTTHKFLPSALRIIEVWGLKYTCCFTWHKNGGFQPFGLPQYNNEFIVYARKGNPKFVDTKDFFTCFNADRTGHSEKPDKFYDTIKRVTGGRRIDIFGRREIDGFSSWGNESGN